MSAPLRLLAPLTPCERFCALRRDMLTAWQHLIEAQDIPDDDLRDEITATSNAMRHLQLLGMPRGR